jgi:3-(3-hydroxy-phenyl)propionate hydroxylase
VLDSESPALSGEALAAGSRRSRRVVGRMCPNPLMDNDSHLDAVIGSGFAVLSAAPLTMAQRERAESRGAVVVTAEAGGALATWLHARHVTAVVVRPDRTVMRAGDDLTELCDALPDFPSVTADRRTR